MKCFRYDCTYWTKHCPSEIQLLEGRRRLHTKGRTFSTLYLLKLMEFTPNQDIAAPRYVGIHLPEIRYSRY